MNARDLDSFLANRVSRPTNYVGDGILVPESRLEVFGESGIMKSVAVHNLAFALAAGVPWLELPIPRPLKVFYLQAEIADAYFWERTEKMNQHFQLAGTPRASNLYLERNLDLRLDTKKGAAYFEDTLRQVKPDVVIVDPLYKFMSGDDNDQHAVKAVQEVIDEVAIVGYSAAVVLVHHSRKPASYAGQQFNFGKGESRGHTTITDWMDTIVQMTFDENKGIHTFTFEKVRNGPMPDPIIQQMNPDTMVFGPVTSDPSAHIISALANGPLPMTDLINRVVASSKVSERTIRRNIDTLNRQKRVVMIPDPHDKRRYKVRLP